MKEKSAWSFVNHTKQSCHVTFVLKLSHEKRVDEWNVVRRKVCKKKIRLNIFAFRVFHFEVIKPILILFAT